ncbi:hypothetical protein [Klebsiella michiganensis]|uniref:hypothetical protein n=1 Tax=Klebsiella michiganensis TaxID=1134687 RepID=UPI001AE62481|nr:hypothetical protein [Klebsiella michiganensis]
MTDITALAQSLKRRAASANEFGEGLFFIKADDVLALVEALEKAQQRIADLESRTVKIPYLPDDCDRIEAHFKYQVAINAAGIKVEAE